MPVPQSTKEFLQFMEKFISQVRTRIKFLRPQDVECVLDILAENYEEWMKHREQFKGTTPNNLIALRKVRSKENHDE